MVWLIFALLTAGAVASVLWPLARGPRGVDRREASIAVYKAQLAEIERDKEQHDLPSEDVRVAKAEAARRLLAAESIAVPAGSSSHLKTWLASSCVAILVPGLSLALYMAVGHPNMPDAPLAARLEAAPQQMDLAAAIAKIEAHLKDYPDDGRGYEVLAPVYLHLGRTGDAVNAARSALRLLGESSARMTLYGETLVAAADGVVTAEAREIFEAAAAKDASAAKPRFFLGLAAEQAGDKARAAEIWSKLVADAPPGAPWAKVLRERMAALAARPGEGSTGLAARSGAPPQAGQMEVIRAMVERLASRLAQDGHDLEGWLRLIRSYTVLQEPSKARSALNEAKRSLADDKDALIRIHALARELGLEG